jgi:hypothetical protein
MPLLELTDAESMGCAPLLIAFVWAALSSMMFLIPACTGRHSIHPARRLLLRAIFRRRFGMKVEIPGCGREAVGLALFIPNLPGKPGVESLPMENVMYRTFR